MALTRLLPLLCLPCSTRPHNIIIITLLGVLFPLFDLHRTAVHTRTDICVDVIFTPLVKVAPREDICWDINNLFPSNLVKAFNVHEFDQPVTLVELQALIAGLWHNTWFTSWVSQHIGLDKKVSRGAVEEEFISLYERRESGGESFLQLHTNLNIVFFSFSPYSSAKTPLKSTHFGFYLIDILGFGAVAEEEYKHLQSHLERMWDESRCDC